MVLAAMLAMMMLAAAPAYAQDATAGDDGIAIGGDSTDSTVVDASQTTAVAVSQTQAGDSTATATGDSVAVSGDVTASLDVSVNQFNGGFDNDFGDDFFVDEFGFVIFF